MHIKILCTVHTHMRGTLRAWSIACVVCVFKRHRYGVRVASVVLFPLAGQHSVACTAELVFTVCSERSLNMWPEIA